MWVKLCCCSECCTLQAHHYDDGINVAKLARGSSDWVDRNVSATGNIYLHGLIIGLVTSRVLTCGVEAALDKEVHDQVTEWCGQSTEKSGPRPRFRGG